MKAVINTLKRTNSICQNHLLVSREIIKFGNTENGLWKGIKRYAH